MVVEKSKRQLVSLKSRQALQTLREELERIENRAKSAKSDPEVIMFYAQLGRLIQELDKIREEILASEKNGIQ